ncbi:FAD-dependent oxidoreductase [Halosimplex salinum]|uniref:FAD-dependent oxidoreductase n=1 Tax=Halosimplex salinum TaxID=1710538 RepID=UPI000F465F10|nr:FAD-dependent oxidoreductase [Halosimplex salinum]
MSSDDSATDSPAGRHESLWMDTSDRTDYGALDESLRVDTAVVGGGIAGVATAYELVEAGQSVAVLERDRILDGVTGRTTAKVTSLHGLVYDHLIDHFGVETARQYADANEAAIEHVAETVDALDIDCEFGRAPAYTYVGPGEDRRDVRAEVEAARRLDLPASYVESTDLPYDVGAAVRFDDQAYFHPRKFLLALAEQVAGAHGDESGDGGIYERTTVRDVDHGDPCRVETDRGDVVADAVVVASHFPVSDDALYFSRLSPKRSYVLAARLAADAPDGLYYDPREPYFSVRSHAGEDSLVLIGGQNHRTGHADSTADRYRALEAQARERFDVESIEYRWATQDYVSVDKVPFVGEAAPHLSDVYVATGFGGWGMTNGVAAAMVLSDLVRGRDSPWASCYDPTRFDFGASKSDLVSHNKHAMTHLFEGYVKGRPDLDLSDLEPGEATVADERDDPVAAYRDEDGAVHAVSAVCPHMGCLVSWNDGESSWDCPCHGSRFDVDGSVLDTPAIDDLDTVELSTSRDR